MNAIRAEFEHGRARVTVIVYDCNLTLGASAKTVIPLGVIVEFRGPKVYGLGLLARTMIAESEAELVGRLARGLVSKPFTFLNTEFERVWDASDRAQEFTELSIRNNSSLRFEVPLDVRVRVPGKIATQTDVQKKVDWSKGQLTKLLDFHWQQLLGSYSNALGQLNGSENMFQPQSLLHVA